MTLRTLALLCFGFLVACNPQTPQPSDDDLRAAEGEMCGGIAGILCDDGLTCVYEGDYPDASGTCVKES